MIIDGEDILKNASVCCLQVQNLCIHFKTQHYKPGGESIITKKKVVPNFKRQHRNSDNNLILKLYQYCYLCLLDWASHFIDYRDIQQIFVQKFTIALGNKKYQRKRCYNNKFKQLKKGNVTKLNITNGQLGGPHSNVWWQVHGKCVGQLYQQEQIGAVASELNFERKVGFRERKDKKVLSRQEVFQHEESELRTSNMDGEKQSQGLEFRVIHQD